MLRGVDISRYQSLDFDFSPYDFGIVKSTEGTGISADAQFTIQADKCLSQGKLLGLYHYARPEYNTAAQEVEYFVSMVKPYIGKAIFCLDWEGEAVKYPTSWIKAWMDGVHNQTGVRPFFYSFANYLSTPGLASIASDYPLWVANWEVQTPSIGVWKKWVLWQYQGDPLDLDYFDGSREDWNGWAGGIKADWVRRNGILRQAEMENNAQLVWNFFRAKGWTLESVCAMLGNMTHESSIGPGVWGNWTPWGDPTYKGYGLVQWTPYTRITNWLQNHGYALDDGDGQCAKIQEELDHPEIENTWAASLNPYGMTFRQFSQSTASPYDLALIFLASYERPAEPHQPQRGTSALEWYKYLRGAPLFEPRLSPDGITGDPKWYANNPFYTAGYGLPNCTCYVWGRWWEITGTKPDLPLGNANTWYDRGVAMGIPHGKVPQLGAIVCTWYADGGHVAVVEQINPDGSIVVSNSGWPSTFFWTETLYPPNYLASWMPSNAYVQGFLYLDTQFVPPNPTFPPDKDPAGDFENKLTYYLKIL